MILFVCSVVYLRILISRLIISYLFQDILGWGESDRGVSYTFGRDVVQESVETFKISLICRAHQVVEDGYQFFQRRQVSNIEMFLYRIRGTFYIVC